MSYRDWPTKLDGNMFSLAKLDTETPPDEIKVTTWSNLFGDGGKVAVEIFFGTKRHHSDLGGITIERNGSVQGEREHLQELVDEWNEDAAENWRALIADAKTRVRAYYEKQMAESAEKLAALNAEVSA